MTAHIEGPLDHIRKLVDYLEQDESDHYDCCDDSERTDHIYLSIKAVRDWLGGAR
jgi:hypothetical protein